MSSPHAHNSLIIFANMPESEDETKNPENIHINRLIRLIYINERYAHTHTHTRFFKLAPVTPGAEHSNNFKFLTNKYRKY